MRSQTRRGRRWPTKSAISSRRTNRS
jgi:hypothetical protein